MALSPSTDQLESVQKSLELSISHDSDVNVPVNVSDISESDTSMTKPRFNAERMKEKFQSAISDDKKIVIEDFLLGFDELHVFLKSLGKAFGWIAADLQKKIKIIREHAKGKNAENYKTVQDMVAFEVQQNLIKHKARDATNGTRNMLRLHRALEYVIAFLKGVPNLAKDEKCCTLSQNAYKQTLMKHHPWLVQKAAMAAMHLLPTMKGLVEKFTGKKFDSKEFKNAEDILTSVVTAMEEIYQIINDVYQVYDLLNLP